MFRTQLSLFGCLLSLGLCLNGIGARAGTLVSTKLPTLPEADQYLPSVAEVSRIELSLSQRQVKVFAGETLLKQYPVAIGRPGWETPVGTFAVQSKIVDPAWQHPLEGYVIPSGDPQNPLGRRWIGFWTNGKNYIGFHGIADFMRPSIGSAASHGCVRMFSEDIEVMYKLVAVGTPVIVRP